MDCVDLPPPEGVLSNNWFCGRFGANARSAQVNAIHSGAAKRRQNEEVSGERSEVRLPELLVSA